MSTPVGVHKESYYQAKIIKWLREAYPQAFVWKAQQGPYSRQGIPDICAIIDGHFFGFEVKRPEGGELSPVQAQTIKQINAAGGTALVVSFPAQAQEAIEKWQTERSRTRSGHDYRPRLTFGDGPHFLHGHEGGRSLGAGSHLRNEYLHRRHVARIHGGRQREKETR